jgi:rubrerythrin
MRVRLLFRDEFGETLRRFKGKQHGPSLCNQGSILYTTSITIAGYTLLNGMEGGPSMEQKARLDALNVALTNEMREHDFYLKHAERTKNPVGKKMFQQIGDEELEHYERLKRMHAEWSKAGKWPDSLPLTVSNTTVKDVLLGVLKSVDTGAEKDADDLEAVRTAIDFEEKGTKYYETLRDQVTNPKEKAFFDLLSKIEREHYLSLKEAEEYLVDPMSWFRKTERLNVDGG